jgi:hypothetical protein
MNDIILQITIVTLGGFALCMVRRKTGVWANPITILMLCLFLPLFFCLFRLSSLQSPKWDYETYAAIWTTIGAWLFFPSLVLIAKGKLLIKESFRKDDWLIQTDEFFLCVRLFSIIVFLSYLLGNYVQAKTILPILNPEIAYAIHAEFPPIIRFVARANPAAVVLLYLLYWKRRKPVDLLLLLVIFLTPLTRLSRIDLALGLVALCVTFSFYPLFQWTKKRTIFAGLILSALLIGGAELGNLRTNRFGEYDITYDSAIEWKPDIRGPANILPIAYGYFPLSFENFDRFVTNFKDKGTYMYGINSFDWVFTGFIKLHWIPFLSRIYDSSAKFMPVSSAATVPTALYPFYADFGPVGMAFPMMLYVSIWIFFFYRSRESFCYSMIFAIYSGAFALSSFQAIIAAPIIIHQVVEIFLLFWFAQRLALHKRRR